MSVKIIKLIILINDLSFLFSSLPIAEAAKDKAIEVLLDMVSWEQQI